MPTRRRPRLVLLVAVLLVPTGTRAAEDRLIADFERADYGDWKVAGEAFGPAPARGTLARQMPVSGFMGKGLVNTYFNGDNTQGTLTSPAFTLDRRYLNFLIGGGHRPGEVGMRLLVDGKAVRDETGADDERLEWATWDLKELAGEQARIEIYDHATGGWGHVNVDQVVLGDAAKAEVRVPAAVRADVLYDETYRPQFHFTAKKGWLNDPNGLVFLNGEYHLFFQHNPKGNVWGNMTWGHAASKDLFHWRQLDNAIEPDALGTAFSGSAVIDRDDTAGFGRGAIVCVYTSAGKPFTQSLAYSTDGGRTFKKYDRNPVLKNVSDGNRDPKVFWHAPTKRWVMALYVDQPGDGGKKVQTISFFNSPDLKVWTYQSRLDGFFECPDVFELAVDGDAGKSKWVAFAADGAYVLGQFDGKTFTKEAGKFPGHFGGNFYAAQTYSDVPRADGRRILIGWMQGGKYPQMPFNQQMTVPMELTLRTTPAGVRMFKWPAREIAGLVAVKKELGPATLKPGEDLLRDAKAELLDLEATIEVGDAAAVGFDVRGTKVRWTKDGRLHVGSAAGECPARDGKLAIRVLVDRSSIEAFGNGGEALIAACFIPRQDKPVSTVAEGGEAKFTALKVRELKSAWR
jgi:sucrose-6-phosphate hydrolase SacC (GH32 family)